MRTLLVAFIGGIIGTVFTSMIVLAWAGPTSAPPSGNVSAPINVGTTDQIKNASLGINALAVFGNTILSGTSRYLNFGTIPDEEPPSSGYGIRDNAGTMEFKNTGGSWRGFLPSTNVQSINFADGTIQTSAAGGATSDTVAGGCTGVGEPQQQGQFPHEDENPVPVSGWGNATNCSTITVCNPGTMSGTCPVGYTATRIGGGSLACIGGSSDCGCGYTYRWPQSVSNSSYYPAPMMCIKN